MDGADEHWSKNEARATGWARRVPFHVVKYPHMDGAAPAAAGPGREQPWWKKKATVDGLVKG